MALYTATFAADASTLLCNVKKSNAPYEASVSISGGFGGGTVAIQVSYNGGVTKTTVAAADGQTAVSTNAARSFYFKLGQSSTNTPVQLYATVTGSTTPTLTVNLADCNG
jgi:hypothetical protein